MDEVSTGSDEMALGARDNNNILALREEGHVTMEACGCAELIRNDSIGAISTPLHRCKGRHHLPIIGEEMQGDQLPKEGKPYMKLPEQAEHSAASPQYALDPEAKESVQTITESLQALPGSLQSLPSSKSEHTTTGEDADPSEPVDNEESGAVSEEGTEEGNHPSPAGKLEGQYCGPELPAGNDSVRCQGQVLPGPN